MLYIYVLFFTFQSTVPTILYKLKILSKLG